MTRINKTIYLFLFSFLFIAVSCKEDIAPAFSFSPLDPKAGEAVKFTNETANGEYWDWFFGDGSKSTYKTPTKTYKTAGIYDVTLRVDSNANFVTTKKIIIYDTIPTIIINDEKVYYQEYFSIRPIVYNPFGYDVTYKWEFSNYAQGDSIKNNIANCEELSLKYSRHTLNESIKLTVNIGDSTYTVSKAVWVNDVKSHSLIMAESNKKILRQRIYENGTEAHKTLEYIAPLNLSSMQAENSTLYLFGNGNTSSKPSITALNLSNLIAQTVITSAANGDESEFYNGYIQDGKLFWNDRYDFIYQTNISTRNATFNWAGSIDAQTASPYYLAAVDRLPDFSNGLAYSQRSGGIAKYDDIYFWAKTGTGKGIFRFTQDEISAKKRTSSAKSIGAILTNHAIETFAIDQMNRKIYFVTNNKELYVSNIDGTNVTLIATECTGAIAIDNRANQLYWTTAQNVQRIQLVTGSSNKPNGTANTLANVANITALTIDTTKR